MTDDPTPLSLSASSLWDGLVAHVHQTMGIVGLPKMLGVESDEEARKIWVARTRPTLERLAEQFPLVAEGPVLFGVGHGVRIQFDVHEALLIVDNTPVVHTMISFEPAATLFAIVGDRLWGESWTQSLLQHQSSRTIVEADGGWDDPSLFPWVAQKPGKPGPATVGASEHYAMLAGLAEDLGFSRVQSLFREFEKKSRV